MSRSRHEIQASVLQALPEPSLLVTEQGQIEAVNPPFLRVLRLSADAILARPLEQWVTDPPEKVARYLQTCARSRQPVMGALSFVSPDGSRTYRCEGAVVDPRPQTHLALVLLRLRPREATVSRFALLNRTIEELHQEIRERRQAEERLRILAEVSTTLAASLDHRAIPQQLVELIVGRYADWCIIYLAQTEEDAQHVITAHVDPAKQELARRLLTQSPADTIPASFVRVMETGQPFFASTYDEEAVLEGMAGAEQVALLRQIHPQSLMVIPLQTRGQTFGVLAFVWSDSGRHYSEADLHFAQELAQRTALVMENARLYQEAREAEARLREFNRSLETLVAERTAELARSNQELDQFAYVASHDLKAPLRAIDHLATWVAEDAAAVLSPTSQVHLAKLRGRVKRMERLLDDLLLYARASRQYYHPEVINLDALIANVVEMLAPPPGFAVHIVAPLPAFIAERVPLELIFRNLIGNAIKHHHRPESGQVEISGQIHNDWIEFAVGDNGPGIEPSLHHRVFEMFQTLRPRDEIEGSGIGLALVKKLVENRGGRLRIDSTVGEGSTFSFTWPIQSATQQQLHPDNSYTFNQPRERSHDH